MRLYDFPFSPNCRKVRAIAYELGIPLEVTNVDLVKGEQRLPPHLARNPNGRVPVLEDGDLVLWESTAIMRYLATGTPLVPTDRRIAAEVDRWLAWQLAHLAPAMSKVGYERIVKRVTKRGEPDEAVIAAATADFEAFTAVLDHWLADHEYVAGPLTIADFALASHYSIAGSSGLSIARYPAVESWLARVLGRDSMKRALSEAKLAL